MSRRDALERFAVAQALYDHLGKLIATGSKSRGGLPGELRAEADAAALDAWEQNHADRIQVDVNGLGVGAVRVKTTQAWRITDPDAYQVWCQDNHHMVSETSADLDKLTPGQFEDAINYIFYELNRPDVITETWGPAKPEELDLIYNAETGVAIDPNTGEQVPGLEWATTVTGTVIEGFKLDGAKSGPAAKYAPVRAALAGLPPSKRQQLLMGSDAIEIENEGE